MTRGLLLKAFHEVLGTTLLLAAALFAIEAVLAVALPTIMDQFSTQLLEWPFFQRIITALLGTAVDATAGSEAIPAITWVHPVVLATVWTHAIVLCPRMPAGEIDRGTADVLFGLPVSRRRAYLCDGLALLAAGAALFAAGVAGHLVGIAISRASAPPQLAPLAAVVANLFCLYLAVAGITSLVSAASDRRGRAIALVFGILLASFLLNFLAQFWEPAQSIVFLSLLDYHKPLIALREARAGHWPLGDMALLATVALVTWAAGGAWFARRDICTV